MSSTTPGPDVHSMLGAYALGAVDAAEAEAVEAHLAECDECRDELEGFLETGARLGAAAAQTPPASLRAAVLAEASRTPQERPVVRALGARRSVWPRLLVAASLLVAVAGIGGAVYERQRSEDASSQLATMQSVLAAPDARMSAARLGDGTVRMIASPSADRAVLIASRLPDLDGRTYQLWSLRDGQASPGDTFSGSRDMLLVEGTDALDGVAITVEPEGGSQKPSSDPVASMDL